MMQVLPSTCCQCSAGILCQGARLRCSAAQAGAVPWHCPGRGWLGDKQDMARKRERELRRWAKTMHSVRQRLADILLRLSCWPSCPVAKPGRSELGWLSLSLRESGSWEIW